ncbi:P-loop containing nucleoside triphosphate hydrolase protein [Mycena rebaudengoi]|nr:P-loop containing nucleoside triphosphate hydrolase protein [Mycena rebaudengoi]
MSVQSRLDGHIRDALRSKKLLEDARKNAEKTRDGGYCSAAVRAKIRNDFAAKNPGKVAHDWQVNIGEALELKLDVSLLAGTGAGKTMPFVMPLSINPDKIIIIISPLNALEEDQARRFEEMGIPAVALNGEPYSDKIHKEIEAMEKRVIITSPNMCLQHDRFRQLLSNPKFADKIAVFVIDEAHCITQWGDKFRTEYAALGTLRAFVPTHVPFLVASATLPPPVLAQVRQTMHIRADNSYHVNLGTDRPNISWGAKSDLAALDFLVENAEDIVLTQTMVFFDDINLSLEALKYLRALLPNFKKGEIAAYSSRRSTRAKRRVMNDFRRGKIKILLTTEAAGMGCDMPYIEQVVQFMVPGSLSIWMQRAGHAGRTFANLRAQYFLSSQNGAPISESEGTVYRKDVEEGLREWIETEECRRDVTDEYFDSGLARQPPTGICCDNCSPAHTKRPWGFQSLLPDKVLTALATKARFRTVEDFIGGGWSPTHARKHGPALLDMLKEYDALHSEYAAAEKEERARIRKQETLDERVRKKETARLVKAQAAAIRAETPPPPRKSRAKKAKLQQENAPPITPIPNTPLRTFHNITPLHFNNSPLSASVQRGFYTSPPTQVPNLLSPYRHYPRSRTSTAFATLSSITYS